MRPSIKTSFTCPTDLAEAVHDLGERDHLIHRLLLLLLAPTASRLGLALLGRRDRSPSASRRLAVAVAGVYSAGVRPGVAPAGQMPVRQLLDGPRDDGGLGGLHRLGHPIHQALR